VPRPRLASLLGSAALAAGLLLVASPILGLAPVRKGNPRAETVQKVFPSAVRIRIVAGTDVLRTASGIAFAEEGGSTYVLTNAHVVEPAKTWPASVAMKVLPSNGAAPLVATVLARGHVPDMDLAVLEVPAHLDVATLAPDDALELGDDLVVIGAPFGKGLSVAAGIVSQVEYELAENAAGPRQARALKTDAAIGYGSSGGGVFDVPSGRLIGLVEGYRTARVAFGKDAEEYAFDVPMPGETFVAPAAKIRRFLAEHGLSRLLQEPAARGPVAAPAKPF
jgi:S1-C subfamily serine protease